MECLTDFSILFLFSVSLCLLACLLCASNNVSVYLRFNIYQTEITFTVVYYNSSAVVDGPTA